jgi:hypothetical protein
MSFAEPLWWKHLDGFIAKEPEFFYPRSCAA